MEKNRLSNSLQAALNTQMTKEAEALKFTSLMQHGHLTKDMEA